MTHGVAYRRPPRLLDLFCGAGGAGMGYAQAGFQVVGLDLEPQPSYPFPFLQGDALDFLRGPFWQGFDVIHASPPCPRYSGITRVSGDPDDHPDLVGPVRELLKATDKPYVIENVVGAPLIDPVQLCGASPHLPGLRVIRHRLFESNVRLCGAECPPRHPLCHTRDRRKAHYGKTDEWRDFVQVTGGGNCSKAAAADAMGIDWMATKAELNDAIPPLYARFIGAQILNHLATRKAA